jgi:hypothetical protein
MEAKNTAKIKQLLHFLSTIDVGMFVSDIEGKTTHLPFKFQGFRCFQPECFH